MVMDNSDEEFDEHGMLNGGGQVRLHADEDEEDADYEYIDLDNLPNNQQEYLLPDNDFDDSDSQTNQGHVRFLNQSQAQEEYNREHYYEDENGDIIQQDADSDYCEDLIEVYGVNGDEGDVIRYKSIHLLVKEDEGQDMFNHNDSQADKYICPETGSHFEFLDMCRRLKKLQKKRVLIDQVIEEEIRRSQVSTQNHHRQQSQEKSVVQTTNAAVNQSQIQNAQNQNNQTKQVPPAAAVVESAKSQQQTQSVIQPSNNKIDLQEVQVEQHQSAIIKDPIRSSQIINSNLHPQKENLIQPSYNEKPQQSTILQNLAQTQPQITRNLPVQIQAAKIKKVKEIIEKKVLPTENNLVTEEGIYNSFHFYGTNEKAKKILSGRYEAEDVGQEHVHLENKNEFIEQLNTNPQNQLKQQKGTQGKQNILKNLLNNPSEKKQICVTEAGPDSHGTKINRKRQEEYDMFFNSNVESIQPSLKQIKHKNNQFNGPFGFTQNQQNTFENSNNKDANLLSMSQMLLNQQFKENEAVKNLTHQLSHNGNKEFQNPTTQPNVFKFKKSTEKLGNKRTPSANSKSKKRNNSQSLGTVGGTSNSNVYHNKTYSLHQIGSGVSSANQRHNNQIQQLLMSFYQSQNNPIPQVSSYSRTNYSKSIYDNKGNNTIRESSRTKTQPIGPKILISGSSASKDKNLAQMNQIYSSVGSSNNIKPTQNKPTTSQASKRQKLNIKKSQNNGLQPRGNTLDNRYSSNLQQVISSSQQNPIQNYHSKQVINQFNEMMATTKHSNGVASNSTTVGMNSQNPSRPASAIKKISGQSPNHHPQINGLNGTGIATGTGSKLNNLSGIDYKNLLSYQAQLQDSSKEKGGVHSIQKQITQKAAIETLKLHKKTNSISSSKHQTTNIQKSRQKSAVGIGAQTFIGAQNIQNRQVPSHVDYNSHVLDQILMTQIETQPGDYNYSTFNEGILMTSADQERIYTMNSNKKSIKNPFILNTGSSKKVRQKSNSKICTSKSRQKNDLFKPMQISNHLKQSAKLRTKPQGQMKVDINNVITKINVKQNESSRAQAHPISSITQQSLIKSKNIIKTSQQSQQLQLNSNINSINQTQQNSIVQSNSNIQSQLSHISKKLKQQTPQNNIPQNSHNSIGNANFPSSTQQISHINMENSNNLIYQSSNNHITQKQQQQIQQQLKSYTGGQVSTMTQISKRYNSIKSSGRGIDSEVNHTVTQLLDKKRQNSKNAPNRALNIKLKPQRISSGNRNQKNLQHLSPPKSQSANQVAPGSHLQTTTMISHDFTNPNTFLAMGASTIYGNLHSQHTQLSTSGCLRSSTKGKIGKKKTPLSDLVAQSYDFRSERCETVS